MRIEKLMMNADNDTVAALERGRTFKAIVALALVFGFAALAAVTYSNSDTSLARTEVLAPATESLRGDFDLGRGAEFDDALTGGVDMHG
ncbi:MAG: hypothetical protein ABJA83_08690 [Burkholderiaceae bacterium]